MLLDENYQPKVTDYGFVRLSRQSVVAGGSNMSPNLNAGNLEPSTKGDVYDFGEILLELATGEVNNNGPAEEGFKENLACRVLEAVDKALRGKGHDDQIVKFFLNVAACFCILSRPQERPPMYEIYQLLKRIRGGHEFSEQPDEFSRICGSHGVDKVGVLYLYGDL